MEFVVFYATKDPSRLREVYPRHHAYVEQFAKDGGLLAIGTFDDPVANGSMAVFESRHRAEEFLAQDPFVTESVVSRATSANGTCRLSGERPLGRD